MSKKKLGLIALPFALLLLSFLISPESFIVRRELQFVGPQQAAAGETARYFVTVVDGASRASVEGATVSLRILGDEQGQRAEAVTDERGCAELAFTMPSAAQKSVQIQLSCRGLFVSEDVTFTLKLAPPKSRIRALLTTDRLLYRPGETIYSRALVADSSGTPTKDRSLQLELVDSEKTRKAQRSLKSDSYGICGASILLRKELPEGRYELRLKDARSDAIIESLPLTIKNYRLPVFRAALVPEKSMIRPGESLGFSIQCRRINGAPLRPQSYVVKLKDGFGKTLDVQSNSQPESWQSVERLSLVEDYPLKGASERLMVELEVTSPTGEICRSAAIVYASRHELNVAVMPEGGGLVPELPNQVYFQLTDAVGRPVKGELSVSVEGKSAQKMKTDEMGFATATILPDESGIATVQASSGEKSMKQEVSMGIDRFSAGLLRCSSYVMGPKSKQTVSLTINPYWSLKNSETVLLLIERGGELISQSHLPVKDGLAEASVEMPSSPGIYTLEAISSKDGFHLKARRRIIVRSTEEIDVTLETSKQRLSPRESFEVTARVSGVKGPTALGVQVVDDALRGLGGLFPFQDKLRRFRYGSVLDGRFKKPFAESVLRSKEHLEFAEEALSGGPIPSSQRVFGNSKPLNEERAKSLRRKINKIGMIALLTGFLALFVAGIITVLVLAYRKSGILLFFIVFGGIVLFCCWATRPTLLQARSLKAGGGNSVRKDLANLKLGALIYQDQFGPIVTNLDKARGRTGQRVNPRSHFPETLHYSPIVLTDENGIATIPIRGADSLTTWQIDVLASTKLGAVAHSEAQVVTQQAYSVELRAPAFQRVGDICQVAVTARNDSARAISLQVLLQDEDWFEVLSPLSSEPFQLDAGRSKTQFVTLKFLRAGEHRFQCSLFRHSAKFVKKKKRKKKRRPRLLDQLLWPMSVRAIEVEETLTHTGKLSEEQSSATFTPSLPKNGVSPELTLKLLYDPLISSLDGVEYLIRRPHGCFEQTSSTTYPNALILDYLKTKEVPPTLAVNRATRMLELGYQRLAGFEVSGGGFSLYGQAPASLWLSAYGLAEFVAISKVRPVDKDMIERTRRFILSSQSSWGAFGSVAETAYIATALIDSGYMGYEVELAIEHLKSQLEEEVSRGHNYTVALMAEAFAAWNKSPRALETALSALKWGRNGLIEVEGEMTLVQSYGNSVNFDSTCIATRALLRSKGPERKIKQLLDTILRKRENGGAWRTTQNTVQALSTLNLARSLFDRSSGTLDLYWNEKKLEQLTINSTRTGVTLSPDLFSSGRTGPLKLVAKMKGSLNYQWISKAKRPYRAGSLDLNKGRMALKLTLSKPRSQRGQWTELHIECRSRGRTVNSPLLMIPLPGGVDVDRRVLKRAVIEKKIAHFEAVGARLVIYLDKLAAGATFQMKVPLRTTWSGRFQSGIAHAYPYYNPEDGTVAPPFELRVREN